VIRKIGAGARMLDIGKVNGKWGDRLCIAFDTNGSRTRVFGSAKQLSKHIQPSPRAIPQPLTPCIAACAAGQTPRVQAYPASVPQSRFDMVISGGVRFVDVWASVRSCVAKSAQNIGTAKVEKHRIVVSGQGFQASSFKFPFCQTAERAGGDRGNGRRAGRVSRIRTTCGCVRVGIGNARI